MIIPVIHVLTEDQTMENINIIKECGLNQVFLISHGNFDWKMLLNLNKKIKEKYPNLWTGINFLDLDSNIVFASIGNRINEMNGLWIDDSFQGTNIPLADDLKSEWKKSGFKGVYFSGVSFKGCVQPSNLEEATKTAISAMDIITTSGPATGISPSPEKIYKMKDAAGKAPLAIASGIDEKNIRKFIHYVDYFLVASSVESSFGRIDKEKLKKLMAKASI